jgi:DNA-binding transcriptional ArsR family regulator/uncharacterized protein YndB with AHSA1/START domain
MTTTAGSPPNRQGVGAVFRALADPNRRRLLDLLRKGPRTTGDLSDRFDSSRFAVMKHLAVLVEAGLVVVARRGRERWNHLNAVPLQRAYERWVRPYEAIWAERLLRLETATLKGKTQMPAPTAARVAVVELEIEIHAPRDRVWKALVSDTAAWWPRDFFAGPAPKSFVIEPKLGGRMYEDWGGGNGLVWAFVIGIEAPRLLVMQGHLSTPFGGPSTAYHTFTLDENGSGATVLRITDGVHGNVDHKKAAQTKEGWEAIFGGGLKAWVEAASSKKA